MVRLTAAQWAACRGISQRHASHLAQSGRIPGAEKLGGSGGGVWSIPQDAPILPGGDLSPPGAGELGAGEWFAPARTADPRTIVIDGIPEVADPVRLLAAGVTVVDCWGQPWAPL